MKRYGDDARLARFINVQGELGSVKKENDLDFWKSFQSIAELNSLQKSKPAFRSQGN
jgi:hypothetical protein